MTDRLVGLSVEVVKKMGRCGLPLAFRASIDGRLRDKIGRS